MVESMLSMRSNGAKYRRDLSLGYASPEAASILSVFLIIITFPLHIAFVSLHDLSSSSESVSFGRGGGDMTQSFFLPSTAF